MENFDSTLFSINELIAMSQAIDNQIEDCQEYLSDPNVIIEYKVQLSQVLEHSKTASAKLNKIFKDNNINPSKN